MEQSLSVMVRACDRSLREADRVRRAALVASDARFAPNVHFQALLDRAASSIRPDMAFWGLFGAIEADEAVVLARSFDADDLVEGIPVGSRIALAGTLLPEFLGAGGALCFDDLQACELREARRFSKASGARSALGIAFHTGAKRYFLRFTADTPTSEPFDDIDRSYIELVAKLFAQQIRAETQHQRLIFAMEHDALTELPNRAKLRAAIAAALHETGAGALIVVDLDRFRHLVRGLGSQTADAVLVEVAFALRAMLFPGERLGRVGPDIFGIYVPNAGRRAARERARHIMSRFAQPFGTGDRAGTVRVQVSASAGIALAPDDARTADELLTRAESAVVVAKAAGPEGIGFY